MDWAEIKVVRAEVVETMKAQLDDAKPIGINILILLLLALPVVLAIMIMATLRLLVSTLFTMLGNILKAVMTPFFAMYLWIDLGLISLWYIKNLCVKLSGEKQK